MSKHKGYKECQEKYMDETMKKFEKKVDKVENEEPLY